MAAGFFRRWNEDALVEARRMVARFKSAEELRDAFAANVAANAPEAWVLYRELDDFEQLGALERWGAFDLGLIKLLLGRTRCSRVSSRLRSETSASANCCSALGRSHARILNPTNPRRRLDR